MSEPIRNQQTRALAELAADCRVDPEDAQQIAEATMATPRDEDPHGRLVDLMRRCAGRTDAAAFAILDSALKGRIAGAEERVLLRPGAQGRGVRRLRAALAAAAERLGDGRLDPGPGQRFDSACQRALLAFQRRMHKPPSGVLDSGTLLAINYVLNEAEAPLLDLDGPRLSALGVRLEFYPGRQARQLVVRRYGQVVDVYAMRGGPAERRPDARPFVESRFSWAPTPRGAYQLGPSRTHVSRAWKFSQIPFGAELRLHEDQVQFRLGSADAWQTATGPDSVFADRGPHKQFQVADFLKDGRLPARYADNDFGHRAVYLTRDGQVMGHMIHATPAGEARYGDDAYRLRVSHGCEHMRPHDLDEATAKGYLRRGTPFLVKGYDEPLPADVRAFLAARGRVNAEED